MDKYFESLRNVKDNQGGFSLIELVVAVGILAILSVVGLVSYAGITENARKTAVEAAAAEVYKGAVAYDMNGDSPDDYKKAADEWKNSAGNDSIEVEIGEKNSDGSFCVRVYMKDRPEFNSNKGAGCDNEGGSAPGDGSGGEDDPGVIVPPTTAADCFDFTGGAITGYDVECGGADVVIPNTINGEAVVGIGNNAFNNKGLTSVELNDGLETIGNYAFARNNLTSIAFPDGLEVVGSSSFQSNEITGHVVFPSSVKIIDAWAFAFNDVKSVEFNEGLETIGHTAFYVNSGLSGHVDFPSSLKSIGSMAFFNTSISSVRVSNNTVMDEVNKPFDGEAVEIIRY